MLFYLQLFSEWLQSRKEQWRKTYATGRKLQSNKKSGKHVAKDEEGSSKQPAVLRPNTTSCETTTTGATSTIVGATTTIVGATTNNNKKRKRDSANTSTTNDWTRWRLKISESRASKSSHATGKKLQTNLDKPQPQPVQFYICSVCRVRSFSSYDKACDHQIRCQYRMYYRNK